MLGADFKCACIEGLVVLIRWYLTGRDSTVAWAASVGRQVGVGLAGLKGSQQ